MFKTVCAFLTLVIAITGSLVDAKAAPKRPHKARVVSVSGCISLAQGSNRYSYDVYNNCLYSMGFTVDWSNGGQTVTVVTYKVRAQPGPGLVARTVRKHAQTARILSDHPLGILIGGSMLGQMSPDHVSNEYWGYTNYSDQYVYAVMQDSSGNIYERHFAPHQRYRYIAQLPLTAIYAEVEPD